MITLLNYDLLATQVRIRAERFAHRAPHESFCARYAPVAALLRVPPPPAAGSESAAAAAFAGKICDAVCSRAALAKERTAAAASGGRTLAPWACGVSKTFTRGPAHAALEALLATARAAAARRLQASRRRRAIARRVAAASSLQSRWRGLRARLGYALMRLRRDEAAARLQAAARERQLSSRASVASTYLTAAEDAVDAERPSAKVLPAAGLGGFGPNNAPKGASEKRTRAVSALLPPKALVLAATTTADEAAKKMLEARTEAVLVCDGATPVRIAALPLTRPCGSHSARRTRWIASLRFVIS